MKIDGPLAKLRLKPTRRLKRLRRHGPMVPRPRRAITAALLGTATPDRWIHRMPPATPRSPSHPTGGKGTVDRMPPATPRSPSHPTGGGKGTVDRMPPASPRSPSHPTGGKGTVDRMSPASPRSPSHPTGGKGTIDRIPPRIPSIPFPPHGGEGDAPSLSVCCSRSSARSSRFWPDQTSRLGARGPGTSRTQDLSWTGLARRRRGAETRPWSRPDFGDTSEGPRVVDAPPNATGPAVLLCVFAPLRENTTCIPRAWRSSAANRGGA